MKLRKVTAASAAVLALAVGATACGGGKKDDNGSSGGGKKIAIGIKFDQPGLGQKTPQGYAGFDVDVATYVAKKLGYSADQIEWKESKSADRETMLQRGDVDFIAATYSITPKREAKVDFAGPYYVAGQQILTRKGDSSITGPDSFRDGTKKVCSVTGSTPAANIEKYLKDKATQLVLFDVYNKCADAVKNKQVDALTTDNVILSGFVSQNPNDFQLVGSKFTQEPYGIGVKKGDTAFRNFINDVLEKIAKDGRYEKAWKDTVGKVDPNTPTAPAVNRY